MKIAILSFKYCDGSGYKVVRGYQENDFKKADEDLKMMSDYASCDKVWTIDVIEVLT